ncbi:MAG: cysteine protease StiP family protein [Clostridia bacterium]|nr:cysteine protease StiP family protein [Clostridia bacterium]
MFSTYRPEDVTILLKDITGQVEPLGTAEREKRIQAGVHYSEMLPIEYTPSEEYLKLFFRAVDLYSGITARAVGNVAQKILRDKGRGAVLVSLARAGTPIGILIRRWLKEKLGVIVPHYTLSIIRGRGIDRNAMGYILSRHPADKIQFVDGWTGKGAIQRELKAAMEDYPGTDPGLAVLSDPAGIAGKAGTRDDFLIASSCLNSTVSGLLSRTFYRKDIIGPGDFHGAAFYRELEDRDLTYTFIDAVAKCFPEPGNVREEDPRAPSGIEETERIRRDFGIRDVNLVKPGIGEATRVLLRRLPWKVLVRSLHDGEHLDHLYRLAEEKKVPLEVYPLACYRACGIIRDLADS